MPLPRPTNIVIDFIIYKWNVHSLLTDVNTEVPALLDEEEEYNVNEYEEKIYYCNGGTEV
eukprot:631168-Ditylum_brightwellii.AAC.1